MTAMVRVYDELAACRAAADRAWLREMRAVAAAAQAELAHGFAGFEADLIGQALGLHVQSATRLVGEALALVQLPALARAVDDGRMSRHAVPRVLDELVALDAGDPGAPARAVDDLLARTTSWGVRTPADWARAARAAVLRQDPRAHDRRRRDAVRRRDVQLRPAADGLAWLLLLTTTSDAQQAMDALRTAAEQLAADPHDTRSAAERRADAAVALITGQPASTGTPDDLFHLAISDAGACTVGDDVGTGGTDGSGCTIGCGDSGAAPAPVEGRGQAPRRRRRSRRRRLVDIVIPAATVLGQSEEPADLRGFGPITGTHARELIGEGCEVRAVFTCHRTGATLAVGPRTWTVTGSSDLRAVIRQALASSARTPVTEPQYVPSEQLTAFLTARDRTSVWPGSSVPSPLTDLEHNQPWQQNGPTSPSNVRPVQRRGHRIKQLGYCYTPLPDGRIRWKAPGRRAVHRPSTRQPPPPLLALRT